MSWSFWIILFAILFYGLIHSLLASLQAKANPAEAKALLRRLVTAQAARPIARELLERLGDK